MTTKELAIKTKQIHKWCNTVLNDIISQVAEDGHSGFLMHCSGIPTDLCPKDKIDIVFYYLKTYNVEKLAEDVLLISWDN